MFKHLLIVVIVLNFSISLVNAKEVTYPSDLWKGIIGEAVSEGYNGMYAVTCVYRNRLIRGKSLGCIALVRKDLTPFVKRQGKRYEQMAKDIIIKVFILGTPDVTKGATHYENIEQFGIPWWAKDMEITCKIGQHTFYKKKV